MRSLKEKSWSVLLAKAYILNDEVRGKQCENCKSTTHALTGNFGNPNLFLYGCKDSKCKNRLLRLEFPRITNADSSAAEKDFSLALAVKPAECPGLLEVAAKA